jgi:hypothetical protein
LPASEVSAPFGIRIPTGGMCSNESGMDKSRIWMENPFATRSWLAFLAPGGL